MQATQNIGGLSAPKKTGGSFRNFTAGFFRKSGRTGRLMKFFVFVPTVLLAVYLAFIHSPMYISEAHFAVRNNEPDVGAAMRMLTPGGAIADAYIVQNYILSPDMLGKVAQAVDLRGHFADKSKDVYSRLWASPTREELLAYWQRLVAVAYDLDKGYLSVEVKAYTPEMARKINETIMHYSEELINDMNRRANQDSMRLAREEVRLAEKRLMEARAAIQKFRDSHSMLDPQITAKGLEDVIGRLEAEAAGTEAELNATLQLMQKNSPRVLDIQVRLSSLKEQIVREKNRLAGLHSARNSISSLVGDYSNLLTEEEFANQQLVTSMSMYEVARVKAAAQSRYLVPFQPPTLPQESLYPRPVLFTLLGFVAFVVIFGIISLTIASIRDHMGV